MLSAWSGVGAASAMASVVERALPTRLLQSLWHRSVCRSLPLLQRLPAQNNRRQLHSQTDLLGTTRVFTSSWGRTAPERCSDAHGASHDLSIRPSAWPSSQFSCAGMTLPLRRQLARCYASEDVAATRKLPSRLAQKALFLEEKTGEALSEEELNAPIPKIGEGPSQGCPVSSTMASASLPECLALRCPHL